MHENRIAVMEFHECLLCSKPVPIIGLFCNEKCKIIYNLKNRTLQSMFNWEYIESQLPGRKARYNFGASVLWCSGTAVCLLWKNGILNTYILVISYLAIYVGYVVLVFRTTTVK